MQKIQQNLFYQIFNPATSIPFVWACVSLCFLALLSSSFLEVVIYLSIVLIISGCMLTSIVALSDGDRRATQTLSSISADLTSRYANMVDAMHLSMMATVSLVLSIDDPLNPGPHHSKFQKILDVFFEECDCSSILKSKNKKPSSLEEIAEIRKLILEGRVTMKQISVTVNPTDEFLSGGDSVPLESLIQIDEQMKLVSVKDPHAIKYNQSEG